MFSVKINGKMYPAAIEGQTSDPSWDGRATKSITLKMSYEAVKGLFPDGVAWSIVGPKEPWYAIDMGEQAEELAEWDNSDYALSGPITDARDGTVTIKMGKLTDLEAAYEMMLGGGDVI